MTDTTTTEPPSGGSQPTGPAPRVLRRCPHHRVVAGVAAGVADYLDVDLALVRVAFVLLAAVGGIGLPAYVAAWLLIPEEGSERSIAEDLAARWRP
jgi:phage shock protein PspC (stress-responsive transcriptional regulator)